MPWKLLLSLFLACIRVISNAGAEFSQSSANGRTDYEINELMFSDTFESDELNLTLWEYEITMHGGNNGEFQIYSNLIGNTFIKDVRDKNGNAIGRALHLKPTLVNETKGNSFLYNGTFDLERCTAEYTVPPKWNCHQTGSESLILPPIYSSRIRTKGKFEFTYGKLEVVAKLPSGDWLWPAIWLKPQQEIYGKWPLSGEIDLMEARGNKYLTWPRGRVNIGSEQVGSTLHFGLEGELNTWKKTFVQLNSKPNEGFDLDFHNYTLIWTPHKIEFLIDGIPLGKEPISPSDDGFYTSKYGFTTNLNNPWNKPNITKNIKMAPFDQPFYLILNVAVGGTSNYFPLNYVWDSTNEHARHQFWEHRDKWYSTWKGQDDAAAMKIKSVKVYAI